MVKYLNYRLHQWSTVDGSTCKYCTLNMVRQSAKNKGIIEEYNSETLKIETLFFFRNTRQFETIFVHTAVFREYDKFMIQN